MSRSSSGITPFCRQPRHTGRRTTTMTTEKYKPDSRLIDDPEDLRRLYQDEGLSIREIAEEHASVGRTRVCEALHEYGIPSDEDDKESDSTMTDSVNWARCKG